MANHMNRTVAIALGVLAFGIAAAQFDSEPGRGFAPQQGEPGMRPPQPPPGGMRMRAPLPPPLGMLMDPDVQAELKLSEAQKEMVRALAERGRPPMGPRDGFGGPPMPPGEGRPPMEPGRPPRGEGWPPMEPGQPPRGDRPPMEPGRPPRGEGRPPMEPGRPPMPPGPGGPGRGPGFGPEQRERTINELKKILDAKQMERLEQLDLQMAGVFAFNRPDVGEKLGLSETQREKIRDILREARPPMPPRPEPGQPGTPPPPPPRDPQAMSKEFEPKVLAVLTETQKGKWKAMQGKKFEFKRRERAPRD